MSAEADHPKEFHIKVNGRERTIPYDVVSYANAVELAGYPPPTEGTEYIVTYNHAVAPKEAGDLIAGESVTVKNGTEFVVEPGNRS